MPSEKTKQILDFLEEARTALRQAEWAGTNLREKARYLTEAASVHLELSKLTGGSTSEGHSRECARLMQLVRVIESEMGTTPEVPPAPQPAPTPEQPDVQKPVPQPAPQTKPAAAVQTNDTSMDGLDLEGFVPSSIQMLSPGEVTFDDLIEMDEAVDRIKRFFETREIRKLHAEELPVVLLYGPPGSGKTFFMRAIGNYVLTTIPDSAFFFLPLDVLHAKYVGVAEDRLIAIFREMAKYKNPVLCIGKVDALVAKRDGDSQGQYGTDIMDLLLQLMNDVKDRSNVVLIGGTCYPWNIDPHISCMAERIHIRLPSRKAVADYLVKSLEPFVTKEDGILQKIAEETADKLEHIDMRALRNMVNRISTESFAKTVRANPDNSEIEEFIPVAPERVAWYASKYTAPFSEEYYDRLEHPEKW